MERVQQARRTLSTRNPTLVARIEESAPPPPWPHHALGSNDNGFRGVRVELRNTVHQLITFEPVMHTHWQECFVEWVARVWIVIDIDTLAPGLAVTVSVDITHITAG